MNSETTDRLAWRLKVYPLAILLTLGAVVVLLTIVYDEADPSSRLGGDYPAFYGAGAIVADGDWDDLYKQERQQREQSGLIDDEGGYLYFSYPPFVAGAYGLLAPLGYQLSYLVNTLLMAGALAGCVWLLWPWLRRIGWPPLALYAAALAFYPVLRAVPGGQNTTLSLLLLSAAIRLEREDRPVTAGVALAMLLYKPQFGVVIVPLLLVARRWRILAGWAGGAAGLYAISAVPLGWGWPSNWWEQATGFSDLNAAVNGSNFVSLPGFAENLSSSAAGPLVGYALAAAFGLWVARFWWRHADAAVLERYALAGAAVVLAAPQTLFYDAGLVLLGLLAIGSRAHLRYPYVFAAAVAVSWIQLASGGLGWSPLGPLSWLAAGWFAWHVERGEFAQATPV